MNQSAGDGKGNKSRLPSKPCASCARAMSWRKRWERCWQEVRFCSAACRRRGVPGPDRPALRDKT
ncbi:MAG: DUF2256 domain-containing protein [Dokdonella sp.]